MYQLIFSKKAVEELNKFEKLIKERIWNKLQQIKEHLFRFFEKLVEISGFKLRIGNYRVIADIDKNSKKIYINKIGHRKNIYER